MSELPFIDAHTIAVNAPSRAVWAAVDAVMAIERPNPLARALGCVDDGGFHVVRDERPALVALGGAHRFARYELRFVLGGEGALRAETRAQFPGLRGALYRALVIGTRGHVLATRYLLHRIKRRAESGT